MLQGCRIMLLATVALLPPALAGTPAARAQTVPALPDTTVRPPISTPPPAGGRGGRIEVPALPPTARPSGAEELRFRLDALDVDGATAIDAETIRQRYAGLLGREISVADLYGVADAITTLYRERGYVLSRAVVPPQSIDAGRARIVVVEGYVAEVQIEGDVGPVRSKLESYLKKLEGLRPVRVADLERYLLLANDLPGVQVRGVLRPVAGHPGAAALVVETDHQPLGGFATINNRGSKELGPWSLAGQIGMQSVTAAGEEVHVLGYSTLFDWEEQRYIEMGGSVALGSEGTRVGAYASYGPSEPGGVVKTLDAEADAARLGIYASHPLLRTREFSLWAQGGYEWTRSRSDLLGTPIVRERVAELYAGARIEMTDGLDGFTRADLRLRRGISALGGSDDSASDRLLFSRADGEPDFTAANAELSRRQPLGGPFELFGKVAGQYSWDKLLSPSQVKFGGLNYLRGYSAGELAGDSGVAYSLEARMQDRLDWPNLVFVQGYVFVEQGWAWNRGGAGNADLASTGVGVRLLPREWWSIEAEVAHALADGLVGDDAGRRPTRLYVTSTVRF